MQSQTTAILETILECPAATHDIRRGLVLDVTAGDILVLCDEREIRCELLYTSATPPLLARGDTVLVWLLAEDAGIVLGRLGASHAAKEAVPDELVLEARHGLTLQCGEGSITLRSDGKVLIKGKDLVSHAKQTNRIKGGTVVIN